MFKRIRHIMFVIDELTQVMYELSRPHHVNEFTDSLAWKTLRLVTQDRSATNRR